jgi:precorrin-2 dehydrogenase/sirohydrochlorin ferrochelatase
MKEKFPTFQNYRQQAAGSFKYYPVFLNLNGKTAVVIGGGKTAERKALTLLKAGASVKIISPNITTALEKLKKTGKLTHIKRPYRKGDVKGAFIVIAGTSSQQINTKIAREAKYLVNVIDTPSEGNFIAPSIVKRGPLTIAISTGGSSPAASKRIRKELEKLYGVEFAHYLRFLGKMRKKALREIKDSKKRESLLKNLASEKIFKNLRTRDSSCISKLIRKEFSRKTTSPR